MTTVIPFNKGSRIDVTQCEPGLVMLLDGTLRWLKADGTLVPVPGAGGGAWGEASTAQFSGSGSPIGVVTPSGKGDLYVDEDTPALWQATGLTNADWQPATGGSRAGEGITYLITPAEIPDENYIQADFTGATKTPAVGVDDFLDISDDPTEPVFVRDGTYVISGYVVLSPSHSPAVPESLLIADVEVTAFVTAQTPVTQDPALWGFWGGANASFCGAGTIKAGTPLIFYIGNGDTDPVTPAAVRLNIVRTGDADTFQAEP